MKTHKDYIPRPFDYIGLGQMKCGSTALWHYILKHPDVYGPDSWIGDAGSIKEPNFFNTDPNNEHTLGLHKYTSWFESINAAPADKLTGEFTVHYLDREDTLKNIKLHSPDARLFAILRDPVDRAYSQFNWINNTKGDGTWNKHISEVVYHPDSNAKLQLMQKSLYAEQIKRVFDIFDKDQVHFVKYEDYKRDNENEVLKVLSHIGLDTSKYEYTWHEAQMRDYIEPLDRNFREILIDYALEDIKEVEKLIGWDCSDWKTIDK